MCAECLFIEQKQVVKHLLKTLVIRGMTSAKKQRIMGGIFSATGWITLIHIPDGQTTHSLDICETQGLNGRK